MSDAFTFENLWKNHPEIVSDGKHCDLKKVTNQCAVNIGTTLTACGIDTYKLVIKKEHCWAKGHKGHVLKAEVLAHGLRKKPFKGLGSLQKITPEDFNIALAGKTGIIFFKDYWRREPPTGRKETFANRSGDHIDLWNG